MLLETIAALIPEGQTMTPALPDRHLAQLIGCDERTIRSYRRLLRSLCVIRVVGGGRGRTASYELLALEGAGADPSLPLIGATPRPRPRSAATMTGPTLFDPPVTDQRRSIRSYTVGSLILRTLANIGSFFLRCANVGSFFRRWASNVGSFFLRWTSNVGSAVDIDDARARDVHTLKNVHTHTAARSENPDDAQPATPPIAPPRHPWHAWCGDRVCVPRFLHDEFIGKQQRVGEVRADVEARLIAFYRKRSPTGPIGDKDDAAFWRRMYGEEFASVSPATERAPPAPRAPWCRDHDPPCQRWTEHNARLHADVVAAREQKSG